MNKTELKKLLKPLIKECIKEVMFEDGVLSKVVSEVAQGISAPRLVESQSSVTKIQKDEQSQQTNLMKRSTEQTKNKFNKRRQKLMTAIGKDAYNGIDLFEGTAPLSSGGNTSNAVTPQGPLANISSGDPGVDINNLLGNVGAHWKAHMDSGS